MAISECAGRPADPSMLVDVDRLVRCVLRDPAGPVRPDAAGRVRDIGPSRIVAQRRLQRGPHRGDDRGDLPLPRRARARRPAVHREGPARAVRTGLRDGAAGPRRARRRRPCRCRRRLHADPGVSHAILVHNRGRRDHLADGIVVTPSHNPPEDGGFKYNPPNGGPADTDVTSVDPGRGEPAAGGGPRRRPAGARSRRPEPRTTTHDYVSALRRRSRLGHRHGRDPRAPGCGSASTRSAAPASPTGRPSASATAST